MPFNDDYSHTWKAQNGYYNLAPFTWLDDATCDYYEVLRTSWEASRPFYSDYMLRRLFGLIKPTEVKRLDKDEIRERIDFVALLDRYGIRVRWRGERGSALCPWHDEKTASLTLHKSRKIYYCFGCDERGDVFSLIMKMEGVDFKTALTIAQGF